jgi:positive regulator of sigma E activity
MSLRLTLTLLIYVALGVVADIFIALYYMALSERRAFRASLYAVIIPLFTFGVIERALTTHNVTCIVGFVIGNGIGTYFVVRHNR